MTDDAERYLLVRYTGPRPLVLPGPGTTLTGLFDRPTARGAELVAGAIRSGVPVGRGELRGAADDDDSGDDHPGGWEDPDEDDEDDTDLQETGGPVAGRTPLVVPWPPVRRVFPG